LVIIPQTTYFLDIATSIDEQFSFTQDFRKGFISTDGGVNDCLHQKISFIPSVYQKISFIPSVYQKISFIPSVYQKISFIPSVYPSVVSICRIFCIVVYLFLT